MEFTRDELDLIRRALSIADNQGLHGRGTAEPGELANRIRIYLSGTYGK